MDARLNVVGRRLPRPHRQSTVIGFPKARPHWHTYGEQSAEGGSRHDGKTLDPILGRPPFNRMSTGSFSYWRGA